MKVSKLDLGGESEVRRTGVSGKHIKEPVNPFMGCPRQAHLQNTKRYSYPVTWLHIHSPK